MSGEGCGRCEKNKNITTEWRNWWYEVNWWRETIPITNNQGCHEYGYPWNGIIHIWISELGHTVDISMDMWCHHLISVISLIQISDITNCVCVEDTNILLLLWMLHSFLFLFFRCPNTICARVFLWKQVPSNWNFNTMCRMVSIHGQLFFQSKLQLFKIMLKHYSKAVCTLLLCQLLQSCRAAGRGPANTWQL